MSNATNFLSRYWRIISFIIALILIFWLIWTLLNVLLPFFIGLILAYLLLPIISWIEKKLPSQQRFTRLKRVLLVILIYLLFLAFIGVILFYTIPLIVSSVSQFITNLPQIIPEVTRYFENLLSNIRSNIPPQIQGQVDSYLADIGNTLANAFSSGFQVALSYASATFGFVLGFISLPVFLFFLLLDAEKLSEGFYSAFSPWLQKHIQGVVAILNNILGRYIRSALILGLTVGILDFIGLLILGIPFAPALALWAGLTEMVPVFGPWAGGIVGVVVTLATDTSKTLWVIIMYLAVQILENNVLVPRIHSQFLKIHPAVILLLLVLAGHFAGIWGIILAVPLSATIVQIWKYLIRSIREEGLKIE